MVVSTYLVQITDCESSHSGSDSYYSEQPDLEPPLLPSPPAIVTRPANQLKTLATEAAFQSNVADLPRRMTTPGGSAPLTISGLTAASEEPDMPGAISVAIVHPLDSIAVCVVSRYAARRSVIF